jgi:L-alanine-DL-glutamate epimerase-like enolase superfamily enzyme
MPGRIPITRLDVSVFTIPTDYPESDGTYEWTETTLVLVQATAGGKTGIGYTYADISAAELIRSKFSELIQGEDALHVTAAWAKMVHSIRNLGRPGISSMAISAVDTSLWDLKAKLLNVPLVKLFGQSHEAVAIYGIGGFTSYSNIQLANQLSGWVQQGITRVKMKIGRDADADVERVWIARSAIGKNIDLFVDANGAYSRKQALKQAEIFANSSVTWFEEPVSADDLDGLRLIRDRAPAGMDIAAGEYGYDVWYFRRMLDAGAVDVLQADATRCAGFTGFLQAAALCEAHHLPLSVHCAPALHVHIACSARPIRHVEYFHDHVRIENMLFDGVLQPTNGVLCPDLSRAGIGLELKRADAERFAA